MSYFSKNGDSWGVEDECVKGGGIEWGKEGIKR
jgi:hypothetical protein